MNLIWIDIYQPIMRITRHLTVTIMRYSPIIVFNARSNTLVLMETYKHVIINDNINCAKLGDNHAHEIDNNRPK